MFGWRRASSLRLIHDCLVVAAAKMHPHPLFFLCATSLFFSCVCMSHAAVLKAGGSADVPTYDFTVHSRTKETKRLGENKRVLESACLRRYVRAMIRLSCRTTQGPQLREDQGAGGREEVRSKLQGRVAAEGGLLPSSKHQAFTTSAVGALSRFPKEMPHHKRLMTMLGGSLSIASFQPIEPI